MPRLLLSTFAKTVQAIEGLPDAEACDKYMFVETYADWTDHAKTLKLGSCPAGSPGQHSCSTMPCYWLSAPRMEHSKYCVLVSC